MLVGLQCLHVFWFALILNMAWKLLFAGEIKGDVRESDDEDDESEMVMSRHTIDGDSYRSTKICSFDSREPCLLLEHNRKQKVI